MKSGSPEEPPNPHPQGSVLPVPSLLPHFPLSVPSCWLQSEKSTPTDTENSMSNRTPGLLPQLCRNLGQGTQSHPVHCDKPSRNNGGQVSRPNPGDVPWATESFALPSRPFSDAEGPAFSQAPVPCRPHLGGFLCSSLMYPLGKKGVASPHQSCWVSRTSRTEGQLEIIPELLYSMPPVCLTQPQGSLLLSPFSRCKVAALGGGQGWGGSQALLLGKGCGWSLLCIKGDFFPLLPSWCLWWAKEMLRDAERCCIFFFPVAAGQLPAH